MDSIMYVPPSLEMPFSLGLSLGLGINSKDRSHKAQPFKEIHTVKVNQAT